MGWIGVGETGEMSLLLCHFVIKCLTIQAKIICQIGAQKASWPGKMSFWFKVHRIIHLWGGQEILFLNLKPRRLWLTGVELSLGATGNGSVSKMLATWMHNPEFDPQNPHKRLDRMACSCNPSTWEVEMVKSQEWLARQPSLKGKTVLDSLTNHCE